MLIECGPSRSFPEPHALLDSARREDAIVVAIGEDAGAAIARVAGLDRFRAALVELGGECLGVHCEAPNVLGFARFRLGGDPPSPLVELVRHGASAAEAVAAGQAFLGEAGFEVALCNDFAGRIVDRLIRPYFNAVLTRLDEGLASAADLDLTLRLGLGYPEGPVALLERSGLAAHFAVSQGLFEAYGERAYAPARRARVAHQRQNRGR